MTDHFIHQSDDTDDSRFIIFSKIFNERRDVAILIKLEPKIILLVRVES